ncbi:hypothetical protein ACHAWF_009554, partial [Thalassiosira exigua]
LPRNLRVRVVLRERLQPLRRVALGPLQRQPQRPIPVQLTQSSHGPRHPEQHRVVPKLGEAVVPQQHARVGVDVGVRVANLPVLGQDPRHDLVDGVDDLEEGIVGHVLQPELALAGVSGVGLAEDGVAVARDDLLGVERLPREFGDGVGVHFFSLLVELGLEGLDPLEDLLVREAVEGTGQRVEARGVREVRIREGGSHEVGGVRRGVASLVIGVDAEVEAHELVEAGVVVPEHPGEISGVVEGGVLGDDAVEVDVAVDGGGDLGDDREDVEDVLERVLVVLVLGHAIGVRLRELTRRLRGVQPDGKLGHGVHVLRQAVEQGDDVIGQRARPGVQLRRQAVDLLLRGHFRSEQEPDERLEEGLAVPRLAGEGGEDLRDGGTRQRLWNGRRMVEWVRRLKCSAWRGGDVGPCPDDFPPDEWYASTRRLDVCIGDLKKQCMRRGEAERFRPQGADSSESDSDSDGRGRERGRAAERGGRRFRRRWGREASERRILAGEEGLARATRCGPSPSDAQRSGSAPARPPEPSASTTPRPRPDARPPCSTSMLFSGRGTIPRPPSVSISVPSPPSKNATTAPSSSDLSLRPPALSRRCRPTD